MALKLIINIAKKIPGPQEFSSVQASCSIEGELATGQDPVAEAAKLYAQAERAVDHQLGSMAGGALPAAASSNTPVQPPVQRQTTSQPYQGGQRRGPAPITDSQLRFLDRLIVQTRSSIPAILEQHQVGSLRDLSCKAAAGLIDQLKGLVPA